MMPRYASLWGKNLVLLTDSLDQKKYLYHVKSYRYIQALCLGLMIACEATPTVIEWNTIVVDSLYAVDLPSNVQAGYDMHPYASLQYYSIEDQIYLIGIEDAKENLGDIKRKRLKIKGYYAFVENTVLDQVDTFYRESLTVWEGYPGLSTARIGDYYVASPDRYTQPLFYRIGVFESDDYFLQLVMWLPYNSSCDKVALLDSIAQSFQFVVPTETASR